MLIHNQSQISTCSSEHPDAKMNTDGTVEYSTAFKTQANYKL